MEYLDFELPLKELKDQLEKCNVIGDESKVDVRDTSKKLKEKIEAKKKEIYSRVNHSLFYEFSLLTEGKIDALVFYNSSENINEIFSFILIFFLHVSAY